MARRLFDMIDIVEVLQHWYSGRSKTDVATSVGIDRGTIRKYVTPAETAGMVPGGELVSRAEWAVLAAGWFPELVDAKARSLTFGEINEHCRHRIVTMLVTNKHRGSAATSSGATATPTTAHYATSSGAQTLPDTALAEFDGLIRPRGDGPTIGH